MLEKIGIVKNTASSAKLMNSMLICFNMSEVNFYFIKYIAKKNYGFFPMLIQYLVLLINY